MNMEGSKEKNAYMEAKKEYLAKGKSYSVILRKIMDLDPGILRQAEEILVTGDGLSLHDNRFLTTFYNELKAKSKIDKQYFEYLLELKKAKNELDISIHNLSRSRVAFLLRKAGIPPKRVNYTDDTIASQINNREISLLEKISLPNILDVQSSETLDELVSVGDIICENGVLISKTKSAKDFIKKLELDIRQGFNNKYLTNACGDILKQYSNINASNLLDFIRLTADREHIREIERKIDSGEISLSGGTLVPLNTKGKKYLSLLIEELSGQLHKKVKSQILAKNDLYVNHDPRINKVKESLSDFDISIAGHSHLGRLAINDGVYATLLHKADIHRDSLNKTFTDILTLQETISGSFADIKKQLIFVVGKNNVDIDKVLTLLISVRYLSLYESEYETKLTELENKLGILSGGENIIGPETLMKLHEKYGKSIEEPEVDGLVRGLVSGMITDRKYLGPETNRVLIEFMLNSSQVKEYKDILKSELIIKKHILDMLNNRDCLYVGLENMSEVLTELTEIDIEKKEKLADITHELELAHKELWLSKITNTNKKYIEDVYADLPVFSKDKARGASRDAVENARKEVRETFAKYRSSHKEHSDKFAGELRKSLAAISKGGDISKISADLKGKYRAMSTNHEKLVAEMEKDIMTLEKRLTDFEDNSPSNLEKLLISDIRKNI